MSASRPAPPRRRELRFLAILLACLLVPASAIGWIVSSAAARTDQVSARHEARLAQNAWDLRKRAMAKALMTETVWDEAVRNLDQRFDRTWAEANMTVFFTETSGYQLVVVLDAQDRPMLSHADGREMNLVWPQISGEVARMTASIREREAKLQRPFPPRPSKSLVSAPIDAASVVRIGGTPFMLTAALVQPDFGYSAPSRRAPVVLVGQAIDAAFLEGFASANLLSEVRTVDASVTSGPGMSVLPIKNLEGETVAGLAWTPEAPGDDLVRHLAPPLAALVLTLFLLPVGLYFWERRRTRQLQEARDAAEAASIAKSQFLANMSHEIRTPLNGVLGVAGALAKTRLSPNQREMVDLVCASATSLEALLSDILDLARVESGALEIRCEAFDLAASVRACAALFDAAAQAKGLDLHVAIDPAAVGSYLGDAPRIRQILSNLLSNAVKFTAAGQVTLEVRASDDGDRPELTLEVRDSGIGFDAETAARLFTRFEQGDGSITRRYGGSGLGLAISRTLARAMGGDLTATSVPGEGSAFMLRVPLPRCAADPAAQHQAGPAEFSDAEGLRVLLAEDHPTNRRVVELILGSVGVDLTCVGDGAQAVAAFETQAFDLVLMDMQMPVMDGLTAIREIRRMEAAQGHARTPIYVLTANAMPEHAASSAEAGADGHISKPVTPDRLLEVVSDVALGKAEAPGLDLLRAGT